MFTMCNEYTVLDCLNSPEPAVKLSSAVKSCSSLSSLHCIVSGCQAVREIASAWPFNQDASYRPSLNFFHFFTFNEADCLTIAVAVIIFKIGAAGQWWHTL